MWRTDPQQRYSDMRHEMPFLVAEEDRVAASIRVFFRKRANGRIVQFDIAAFYTLRDGRIAEYPRDPRFVRTGAADCSNATSPPN